MRPSAPFRMPARPAWTQPVCAPCWYEANPGRTPTRVADSEPARCARCGTLTNEGIAIRCNPDSVGYPAAEEGYYCDNAGCPLYRFDCDNEQCDWCGAIMVPIGD